MLNAKKNIQIVRIVESHLGGTFLSGADPEVIESYCEQCGDCDRIIGGFPADDEEAAFTAITVAYTEDLCREIRAYAHNNQLDPEFEEYAREKIDDLCSADSLGAFFDMLDVSAGWASLMYPSVHEAVCERFLAQGADLKASLTSELDAACCANHGSRSTA